MATEYVDAEVDPEELNTYFPDSTTTSMPLVFINSFKATIPNEPKIISSLGIIDGPNGDNRPPTGIIREDMFDFFSGIGIEVQGASTLAFEKEGFSIEFQNLTLLQSTLNSTNNLFSSFILNKRLLDANQATVDLDVALPLLGMPEEEDWIAKGPFIDRTYIRNALSFDLSSKMGAPYAPKTRFAELYITDQRDNSTPEMYHYHGLYVFTEKIKRDKNRIDINKLKDTEDPLDGGYIIAVDNPKGVKGEGWNSNITSLTSELGNAYPLYTEYLYEHPKNDDITDAQKKHIQDFMYSFEQAVFTHGDYGTYIDLDSFADYFLLTELSKNPDGYRHSTFFFKDKGADAKLKAGPVWDFNEAYGNTAKCDAIKTDGWQFLCGYNYPSDDSLPVPGWWAELAKDDTFARKLDERWTYHRQTGRVFDTNRIRSDALARASALKDSGAVIRDQMRWKTAAVNIPPGLQSSNLLQEFTPNAIHTYYDKEVDKMLEYLEARVHWMDTNLPSASNSFAIEGVPPQTDAAMSTTEAAGGLTMFFALVTVLLSNKFF